MELHHLFFIFAGLLIAVLVGFSFWSARREKSRIFSNTFSTRPPASPINNTVSDVPVSLNPQSYSAPNVAQEADNSMQIQQEVENGLREIKINLPNQEAPAFTQTTPIYGNQAVHAQSEVAPTPVSVLEQSVEELERQAAQGEVDIYSDASVRVQLAQNSLQNLPENRPLEAQPQSVAENGVITLYVVAPEGQQFEGNFVVQCLEAIGFQYGEYQIFHRHQHLGNSTSPVIYSVANMMQPGVFDLNKLDQFATVGLVLFMHLPSEGNDAVNLKLLLKDTENLARSLGGFVLNEQRELFDEASRQAYLVRVS